MEVHTRQLTSKYSISATCNRMMLRIPWYWDFGVMVSPFFFSSSWYVEYQFQRSIGNNATTPFFSSTKCNDLDHVNQGCALILTSMTCGSWSTNPTLSLIICLKRLTSSYTVDQNLLYINLHSKMFVRSTKRELENNSLFFKKLPKKIQQFPGYQWILLIYEIIWIFSWKIKF